MWLASGIPESGVPRLLPIGGLDTSMPPQIRTVPTSITVPPTKQMGAKLKKETRNESQLHQQFRNGDYLPRAPADIMYDQGLPMHMTTPRDSIQRTCALIMTHCCKCKSLDCILGDSCRRNKALLSHIMNCKLGDRCSVEECFQVKSVIDHFSNCRLLNCSVCLPLRAAIGEARVWQSEAFSPYKLEPSGTHSGVYGLAAGPIRKPYYYGYPVEPEPEAAIFPPPPKSNYFLDPGERAIDHSAFKLGTSLFETFDPKEIDYHLRAVRKSAAFPGKPDECLKEKVCVVCLLGEQTFQPIQLYCDCCFGKIKRGGIYWKTKPDAKIQVYACHKCFSAKKNGHLTVGDMSVEQSVFHSYKNDECVTETWVECDKCSYWVHSSCGLFNRGENNEDAKYMCPFCLKQEMESGRRERPLRKPMSMWGAEELSECHLSKFLQQRINDQILKELQRLNTPDVKCSPLVVRVLMSTQKVTKVQNHMAAAFPDMPKEYPYTQRAIGVFQKIHGVDVLLFCMYVQEYGDRCQKPNRRWVNLEYIDSVKHFSPDIKTVRGESLRSAMYKETLLGYIEYVKRCGFEVFYIWACPPGKEGEDYILHCKPKTQKIPTADRLRVWYKELQKAAKQRGLVIHDSNLMDTFFTNGVDRARGHPFSADEMPYFEGDYWPGEAEKILKSLGSSLRVQEVTRKPGDKRKTRGEMSLNESLENGLKSSLPFPRWSDFMVWHLQEPCSLCSGHILAGKKYVYNFDSLVKHSDTSKKRAHFEGIKLARQSGSNANLQFFQICKKCHQTCKEIGECPIPDCVNFEDLEEEEVRPIAFASDEFVHSDETRFSETFESRQSFLAFCKVNHYQFDTLQHAKHSSMMLLYHLHNSKTPAFPAFCERCGTETGSNGDRPNPQLCPSCQSKSLLESQARPPVSIPDGRQQLIRLTESFDHAAYCPSIQCAIPQCRKMKELFRHSRECKLGAPGKCKHCCFFVRLAKHHSHRCNQQCFVPDCERFRAIARQHLRLAQAQRSRIYFGETSGSSSSS